MNELRRDPIQDWADVSARAAAASGYRSSVRSGVRPIAGLSIGALALAVAVVVAVLSLRPTAVGPGGSDALGSAGPSASIGPSGSIGPSSSIGPSGSAVSVPSSGPKSPAVPVVDRVDDGMFRLEITTPQATYGPDDAIEPVATLTYLGPDGDIQAFHAARPIGFTIEEVDGKRTMGGGMDEPCKSTILARDVPLAVPFMKAGSPDATFDQGWYLDPVLRLPAGTWRIAAFLYIWIGDGRGCGAEQHQLVASNMVVVEPR